MGIARHLLDMKASLILISMLGILFGGALRDPNVSQGCKLAIGIFPNVILHCLYIYGARFRRGVEGN